MNKEKKETNNTIDLVAKQDFIAYALAVDKNRAIPDVRDHLKPVHRRILYSMWKEKHLPDAKLVKSANVVGKVMADFHPHGDSSIYDAMVRLSQEWKMRYPLVYLHGNKGSLDGDPAAAMRYTETRLSKLGALMMDELKEDCVPMEETYDGSKLEPTYLSSKLPNVLINGSMGIGVGMSSNILPHNIVDVCNAINKYLDNEDVDISELITLLQGPDFPTGGIITNQKELAKFYKTGSGSVKLRARYEILEGKKRILRITELPYLVGLDKFKDKFFELVRSGEIEGIDTVLLEDTHDLGVDFQVSLKNSANLNDILSQLFSKCGLETSISMNNVMLVNGRPKKVNLKEMISLHIEHRHETIIKKASRLLEKAERRLEILNGLIKATSIIDSVIDIIKKSNSKKEASFDLYAKLGFSELQANSILEMQLSRLTGLELENLKIELSSVKEQVTTFFDLANKKAARVKVLKQDYQDMINNFGDERRTSLENIGKVEKVKEKEDLIILLHKNNEVTTLSDIATSKKGTKGKLLTKSPVLQGIKTDSSEKLALFTSCGKLFTVDNAALSVGSKQYLNTLNKKITGDIVRIITTKDLEQLSESQYVLTVSKNGVLKKSPAADYMKTRQGLITAKLKDGDELKDVFIVNDSEYIFMIANGRMLKIPVSEVRASGRNTAGVKGTKDKIVESITIAKGNDDLLLYSTDGKGKITNAEQFSTTSRAVAGNKTPSNGVINVQEADEVVILGTDNKSIKISTSDINRYGTSAMGSKIFNGTIQEILLG